MVASLTIAICAFSESSGPASAPGQTQARLRRSTIGVHLLEPTLSQDAYTSRGTYPAADPGVRACDHVSLPGRRLVSTAPALQF